jgi:Cu+-exporting ATPase
MTTETEAITLAVGGMTCAGCASTIQRGLAQIPGVAGADVNVATRRATIRPDGTMDPELLDDAMRAAIAGLGYQVLTPRAEVTPAASEHGDSHGSHRTASHETRHNEHDAHLKADASRAADLLRRLILAVVLTVPVTVISMVSAAQFEGWEWVVAALATPVFLYSGWPFHISTLRSARHRAVQMDTLVTIGTAAAWIWSMVVLLGGAAGVESLMHAHVYFETGAVIVSLILLGKWLEVRSTSRAGEAIRALGARLSPTVRLVDGRDINRESLEHGMHFLVRPGEAVATDGRVIEGTAAIDASIVTGESVPVAVGPGDDVIGGTIATDGALTVEATLVGDETMLAQVAAMVEKALTGKARVQRLADRISSIFVPVVILIALATLAGWLIATGDVDRAFTAAVAVLIISCPCALGLATPLALLVGTGRGAQLGILVSGPEALEDTRSIQTIVLDKTGTLTEGRMSVFGQHTGDLPDAEAATVLAAAASVEARSEHPVAHAIATAYPDRKPLKDFRSTPGQGVTATVRSAATDGADADVTVGSQRLFDVVPDSLAEWAAEHESQGLTVVFAGRTSAIGTGLLSGTGALGGGMTRQQLTAEAAIAVADTVKDTAASAIKAFRDLGLDVVLLTGDNERAAGAVAGRLGIETVHAGVLPSDKAHVIESLQQGGRRVAMVGDGVNDAPALAQADLGIAIGTGADVAREASDLTIVSGDPRAAADAIALSRRTLGVIRGNLFWAFAYNVAAIPLAAFGLLDPMIAAGAMGASSLFVVGNSLRLRRFAGYRH